MGFALPKLVASVARAPVPRKLADDGGSDRYVLLLAREASFSEEGDAGSLRIYAHPRENGTGEDHGMDVSMAKGDGLARGGCG